MLPQGLPGPGLLQLRLLLLLLQVGPAMSWELHAGLLLLLVVQLQRRQRPTKK